jgi:predicted outer membrane repeat protein
VSAATPQVGIRYVARTGIDTGTCLTSGTACLTVQYAVDQAVAGDAIYIAAGTYTGVTLRASTYQHVYVSKALTIQGGYTTTDSFAVSNPIANPTILDAQSGGRVLLFSGVDGTISNLTVQNGNINDNGGGINASNALTLTDVTIISNTASNGNGGGVYVPGAAQMSGVVFQNNRSNNGGGGGLYANGTLALTDTLFLSNAALGRGGGANVETSATVNGGVFQNNISTQGGGGLYSDSSLVALTGTQFLGNIGIQGGGVYLDSGTNRVVNTLFARNVASNTLGAGLYLAAGGGVEILHTTIASPTLGNGSAIYIQYGTVGITDTIISRYSIGISRTTGTVYENYNLFFGTPISTTGSFVAGSGVNDVSGDPKFVNPASNNYHLQIGSTAINTGINTGVTTDIDGQTRPMGAGFDIGYDEFPIYTVYLPLTLKNF